MGPFIPFCRLILDLYKHKGSALEERLSSGNLYQLSIDLWHWRYNLQTALFSMPQMHFADSMQEQRSSYGCQRGSGS